MVDVVLIIVIVCVCFVFGVFVCVGCTKKGDSTADQASDDAKPKSMSTVSKTPAKVMTPSVATAKPKKQSGSGGANPWGNVPLRGTCEAPATTKDIPTRAPQTRSHRQPRIPRDPQAFFSEPPRHVRSTENPYGDRRHTHSTAVRPPRALPPVPMTQMPMTEMPDRRMTQYSRAGGHTQHTRHTHHTQRSRPTEFVMVQMDQAGYSHGAGESST